MLHYHLLTGNTSSILKDGILIALAEKVQHANNKGNQRILEVLQEFHQVLKFKTQS